MTARKTAVSAIFVNLPVTDLDRSIAFYRSLGFDNNPQFTDATAACIVFNESMYAMLLTHDKFAGFAPRPIADANTHTGVLVALSLGSRAEVDRIVAAAVAAGGTTFRDPEDHGFMYGHAFRDPDGHVWEPFWMDPAAVQGAQTGAAS